MSEEREVIWTHRRILEETAPEWTRKSCVRCNSSTEPVIKADCLLEVCTLCGFERIVSLANMEPDKGYALPLAKYQVSLAELFATRLYDQSINDWLTFHVLEQWQDEEPDVRGSELLDHVQVRWMLNDVDGDLTIDAYVVLPLTGEDE